MKHLVRRRWRKMGRYLGGHRSQRRLGIGYHCRSLLLRTSLSRKSCRGDRCRLVKDLLRRNIVGRTLSRPRSRRISRRSWWTSRLLGRGSLLLLLLSNKFTSFFLSLLFPLLNKFLLALILLLLLPLGHFSRCLVSGKLSLFLLTSLTLLLLALASLLLDFVLFFFPFPLTFNLSLLFFGETLTALLFLLLLFILRGLTSSFPTNTLLFSLFALFLFLLRLFSLGSSLVSSFLCSFCSLFLLLSLLLKS